MKYFIYVLGSVSFILIIILGFTFFFQKEQNRHQENMMELSNTRVAMQLSQVIENKTVWQKLVNGVHILLTPLTSLLTKLWFQ
jgi:hypothetical protein